MFSWLQNCFGGEKRHVLEMLLSRELLSFSFFNCRLIGERWNLEYPCWKSTFLLRVLNIMQRCLRETICRTSKRFRGALSRSSSLPAEAKVLVLALMSQNGWCCGLITALWMLEFWCQPNTSLTAQGHIQPVKTCIVSWSQSVLLLSSELTPTFQLQQERLQLRSPLTS